MKIDCDYFMKPLISILKGEPSVDSIENIINPKIIDSNGNGIYHYFSEYSLEKFYNLHYNNKKNDLLIKEEEFKEIIKEYENYIPIYIEALDDFKCDKFLCNRNNQNPLIYSIIKKNYYLAMEFLKIYRNNNLLKEKDYQEIFNILINNGDCLKEECIKLLYYILFLAKESNLNVFDKNFLNKKNKNGLKPIVLICKDFNDNIYDKFNQIIKMKSSNYYEKIVNNDKNIKEKVLNEILIKSKNQLHNFITKLFFPLLNNLIRLGADLNIIEKNEKSDFPKSPFIYLMAYPFFENISLSSFVEKNNIDIYYKDKEGKNAFFYLINNKDKILSISENAYNNAFKFFIKKYKVESEGDFFINAFELCLIRGYLNDAKTMYLSKANNDKIILLYHSKILIYIINYINKPKEYKKILNFLQVFDNTIQYDNFNSIYDRNLFHYICLYSSEDNTIFYIFKEIYLNLIKNPINLSKIDIYKRNALFYLFIDENEKIKSKDPFFKLEFCLKNNAINNLNQQDIYGNNLLFYAVQARSFRSIKLLLDFGVSLDIKNCEENTIYSIASIIGDYKLFLYLYNLRRDKHIFLHKVYSSKQLELFNNKEDKISQIINLYKIMNEPIPKKSIFIECFISNNSKNYKSSEKNIKNEFKTNYICLLSNNIISEIDCYTNTIQIKKEEKEHHFSINQKFCIDLYENFNKDKKNFNININYEKKLIAQNLFQYFKLKNYEYFCQFMINENYNLLSICEDLYFLKYNDELNYYINHFLLEKNLLNYKNQEGTTIFHILAKIQKDISFYKKNNLEKYNISNLFDNFGNTPIFYACKELNFNFITFFTNYYFSPNNNNTVNPKYSLFIETNNDTTHLQLLYSQINRKNMKILKILIDISINTKLVYISFIVLFLIKNYKSVNSELFRLSYKDNLNSDDYIRKIIGLFSLYTQELKGSFDNN